MQYLDPVVNPDNPDVDIVFVHGLNPKGSEDHARQTWTDDGGVFWLQALLPEELLRLESSYLHTIRAY